MCCSNLRSSTVTFENFFRHDIRLVFIVRLAGRNSQKSTLQSFYIRLNELKADFGESLQARFLASFDSEDGG